MPVPTTVIPLPVLVPEQQHFDPFLPTVYGNVDYRKWQSQLVRIDEILRTGMVEATFQRLALADRNQREKVAAEKEQRAFHSLSTSFRVRTRTGRRLSGSRKVYQRISPRFIPDRPSPLRPRQALPRPPRTHRAKAARTGKLTHQRPEARQ